MRYKHLLICLVLVFSLPSSLVMAGDYQVKRYHLPGHGHIQLRVPIVWTDQVEQPPNNLPPTITLRANDGAQFEILLTPIWAKEQRPPMTSEELHANVAHAAQLVQSQAVETRIEIQKLNGETSKGYYFQATDRAPKPGEYKYMTQGMVQAGAMPVVFTILTNDGQDVIRRQALGIIGGMQYEATP